MTNVAAVSPELSACREVSVAYGRGEARVVALENVTLEIGEGERLALWGRSGSGKTTLLHVLGGLVVPTNGEVLWRRTQMASLDAAARGRARAAGVPHRLPGGHLLPHLPPYRNLAFPANPP